MPLYTTDALILRTYKLGETDRIVVFLTRDRGKKRGVAKGARRTRSRFGAALEPLTWADVTYFEKERRELVGLNEADTIRSPLSVPDAGALSYLAYFAELIDEWAPEGDPNERLFRLGASVIEALAAGAPIEPIARYFEYWLLRLQGVYPPHGACHRCGAPFDGGRDEEACLEAGSPVFSCRRCFRVPAGGDPDLWPSLRADALSFLRLAGRIGPERAGQLPHSPDVLRQLELVHRMLILTHLEREPKSMRVLREMRGHL